MSMRQKITERLRELEETYGFHLLFACESGSRAWGFASADSDYDVRFVFAWPRERYLRIDAPMATLDLGIDENLIDLSGWELRKSLGLLRKTNGALYEWLYSPIVYQEQSEVIRQWRDLAKEIFVPAQSLAHYLGLSGGSWESVSSSETTTAKAYLYTLRAVLAGRYVAEYESSPPVLFSDLVASLAVPGAVSQRMNQLIAEKSGGKESDLIARGAVLDEFIVSERGGLAETLDSMGRTSIDSPLLDAFFQEVVAPL